MGFSLTANGQPLAIPYSSLAAELQRKDRMTGYTGYLIHDPDP